MLCSLQLSLRSGKDQLLVDEVDCELMKQDINVSLSQVHENDYRLYPHIRDTIANEMWRDYENN